MSESARPASRVLVIGLDGATWSYLAPLADRGVLPTLRKLMASGTWGDLISTVPPLTPPAWASLVTGTNPGRHGIYHFRQLMAGHYYQQRLNVAQDIRTPTIWQRLNRHGKRVGVMNVPNCHPVYPVDGFLTTDAFSPPELGFQVYPPSLAGAFAGYVVDVNNYPRALPGTPEHGSQMRAFIEENRRVLLSQADTAVRLMENQVWQFFMVAWMVTDRLGHFCWHHIQPEATGELAERCRGVLVEMDSQIDRLMGAAGSDCTVLIVSDHGFGPHPSRFFQVGRWLLQEGYLVLLPAWHWLRLSQGHLPRAWKVRLGGPMDSKHGLVNWRRTRVWADPLGARTSGLRINRRGRYPHGTVDDDEAKQLLRELPERLRALRTPQGERVVEAVQRGEELYHGPHADAAPDLVVTLTADFDVAPSFRRDVLSPDWLIDNRHVLRDGEHQPTGLFLVWGKNVRAAGRLPAQRIEAVAPTILQSYGLPVDDDMDADPIAEVFTEAYLRAFPVRRASAPVTIAAAAPEYSSEDSEEIERRLRDLGYLD